ncbi:MAG TPA: DoxX family membrane protein [Chlorobaculum parvum]|uniref:DoxX family membrane protein n=1 Tax=Chlorobaculum parvum TaxID=274539 RepID=A0A7C5HQD6_9CHLB|nr:DoxX family membrane protein [Chlorobaculum parvum]
MIEFQWNSSYLKSHWLKATGVILVLLLRYLYTLLFLYGFAHKIMHGWIWSDILTQHFTERLGELRIAAETAAAGSFEASVAAFQASYLAHFAIPMVIPIGWIVTIGELIIGVALLLGVTTRINAAFGLFMLLNFAAGGYYNETIPPLIIMSVLFMVLPTGQWLGLDRSLHRKHPNSMLFK